jgi:hypothetical protein
MRTKRKRDYYRAIKRREEWALKLQQLEKTNPLQFLFAMIYGGYISDLIPNKSVLSSIPQKKTNPIKVLLDMTDNPHIKDLIPIKNTVFARLGVEHGVTFKDSSIPKKKKKWLW